MPCDDPTTGGTAAAGILSMHMARLRSSSGCGFGSCTVVLRQCCSGCDVLLQLRFGQDGKQRHRKFPEPKHVSRSCGMLFHYQWYAANAQLRIHALGRTSCRCIVHGYMMLTGRTLQLAGGEKNIGHTTALQLQSRCPPRTHTRTKYHQRIRPQTHPQLQYNPPPAAVAPRGPHRRLATPVP